MSAVNLSVQTTVVHGNDGIVFQHRLADLPGGAVLDLSTYNSPNNDRYLHAGHIIIYDKTAKTYKPLQVNLNAYAEVKSNEVLFGILERTIEVSKPLASIVTMGQVNSSACPFAITDAIKQGLPTIKFV